MKRLLAALALIAGAAHAGPTPPEDPAYLREITRHLYRWYLDEDDVARAADAGKLVYWIVPLHPPLDDGDRSRLARLVLPQLGVAVDVKQVDYTIPELGVQVRSGGYKITRVLREPLPADRPADAAIVEMPFRELTRDLFATRYVATFPDGDFLARLRQAVRKELLSQGRTDVTGTQTVYLSPVSPVANELWVYWETGRMLIRFASDIALSDPVVWEYESLHAHTYDIDEQVVVSFEEVPGSNRYLTRDQVGRILFNCMVYGRRMQLEPPAATAAGPGTSPSSGKGGTPGER